MIFGYRYVEDDLLENLVDCKTVVKFEVNGGMSMIRLFYVQDI